MKVSKMNNPGTNQKLAGKSRQGAKSRTAAKIKRCIIGMLTAVALCAQLTLVPAAAATVSAVLPQSGEMTLAAENGALALYVAEKTGVVSLYNKQDGTVWRSNPAIAEEDDRVSGGQRKLMMAQLEILYYDSANTEQERNGQIASTAKGGLSCKISSGKVTFTYKFPDDNITVPLVYELKDNYLSMSVPISEIEEGGGNKLTEITLLPYMGAGSYDDTGYLFIPDGSGSLIEMNNGKSAGTAVKQRIYGDDLVVCADRNTEIKNNMTFPVVGIHKNNSGLLALVSEGDAGAYVNAYTAGMKKNYNCTYFSFEYRSTGTTVLDSSSSSAKTVKMIADEPISCDNFTVRYYPLQNSGSYTDMAGCYRDYLIGEQNFQKNESAGSVPFYVNCYGALQKQGTFLYIPTTVTVPLTTYKQAAEMMTALDDAGIQNIVFSYDGWSKGGITGKMQVSGKYESKLGGKRQFTALMETAQQLGVTFLPNVNLTDLYTPGSGYTKTSSASATLDGTPGLQYTYNLYSRLKDKTLDPFYLLSPFRYNSVISKFFSSYKTDFDGISLKKAGNILYSDHHKESCDRLQSITYLQTAFDTAREKSETVLTESANAYAALYSDYIMSAPTDDSGYDITDRSVPFYQIVMSGYKSYSVEAGNLSAGTRQMLLKAIETGSSLCYTFTAQNAAETENTYLAGVYNSHYKDWIDTAAAQYDELNRVYAQVGGSTITNHEMLADGVYQTTFSNSVCIRVNYSREAYTDSDGTTGSMDYQILK